MVCDLRVFTYVFDMSDHITFMCVDGRRHCGRQGHLDGGDHGSWWHHDVSLHYIHNINPKLLKCKTRFHSQGMILNGFQKNIFQNTDVNLILHRVLRQFHVATRFWTRVWPPRPFGAILKNPILGKASRMQSKHWVAGMMCTNIEAGG